MKLIRPPVQFAEDCELFLRFQVLSTLAPASLIIPSQGVRMDGMHDTVVWTRVARQRDLCACKRCSASADRRFDGAANAVQQLCLSVCERRAEQWRLRIKPRPDICINLC